MYDQDGFYSDSGFAGRRRRRRRNGGPDMDFGGFDFSDTFPRPTPEQRRRARGARPAEASGGFRDIFSPVLRPQRRRPKSRRRPSAAPTSNTRSNIDFWQAIRGTQIRLNITRQEVCATCHGTRRRPAAASVTCPQCNGTGNVTQMAGAMKFNLTCPRCEGTGKLKNACPTCHGDGRVLRTGDGGSAHSAGRAERIAAARGRQRQRRHHGDAPPAICTSRSAWSRIRSFSREGDNIEIQGAGHGVRKRAWAPRSKCRPSTAGRCSRFRRARRTARSSGCARRAS